MSGFSGGCPCPNCGKEAQEYNDNKPFSYISIHCDECGFECNPVITYLTLDELNECRESIGLDFLTELPTQKPPLDIY